MTSSNLQDFNDDMAGINRVLQIFVEMGHDPNTIKGTIFGPAPIPWASPTFVNTRNLWQQVICNEGHTSHDNTSLHNQSL